MGILNYKYYDSPEGQECFHKMFYMSKHAALISKLITGILEICE